MIEITDETKIPTLADFKEVAEYLLDAECPFCLSEIAGVQYGFFNAEGGGVEVADTIDDDNYRSEKFPDVDSALSGFIVAGKPLAEFIPGITIYPVTTSD